MKKMFLSLATASLLLVVILLIPQESEAVPSFARQTGLACNTCHFQHYPALNQFGRAFKAGGFTQVGGQGLVEGDLLSMPSVLNASLITKIRYVKTNGDNNDKGTNKGELEFPDEAALFLGGRVGEHIGFALEAQMAKADEPMFDTFKMPIGVYEINHTHIEVIPFTTKAMGAAFPTEYLNTGAVRAVRVLENRTAISAQQKIGTATEAQGFALAAYHPQGMAAYTMWQPDGATKSDAGPFLHYIRLAATPQVSGWDLGAGVQWWGGTTTTNHNTAYRDAHAWAIDAQAQGEVTGLPLGVYATYAVAEKTDASAPGNKKNMFNDETNGDEVAWSLLAELGVLPGKATVALAYLDYDSGAATDSGDSATTVGATYMLAQNVELQINHTWYDKDQGTGGADGEQKTYFMLFSAF
ncbi:MAG: hypothetical protein ACE5GF_01750 [Thermodesulfobacteriota bacterium]